MLTSVRPITVLGGTGCTISQLFFVASHPAAAVPERKGNPQTSVPTNALAASARLVTFKDFHATSVNVPFNIETRTH